MGNKTSNTRDVVKAEPRDIRALVAELGFEVPDGTRTEACTAAFQTKFTLLPGKNFDQRTPVSVATVRPHDLLQAGVAIGVLDREFEQFIARCIADGVRFSGRVIVWDATTSAGVVELVGAPGRP